MNKIYKRKHRTGEQVVVGGGEGKGSGGWVARAPGGCPAQAPPELLPERRGAFDEGPPPSLPQIHSLILK